VPVDHLYAAPVLNDHFQSLGFNRDEIVVVSADEGGIKRALGHATRLGVPLAIVDKRRTSADATRQENVMGANVKGKVAFMFDDMISTASSICGAAKAIHLSGAREIHVAATHGLLVGPAIERLEEAPISTVAITDTIPLRQKAMLPKIKVLTVAALLGQAIKRIHRNESVSGLFL
jgi:ribose-phosphate pyrophosphokinase